MYCKVCGTKMSDDAQFCSSCGSKIEFAEVTQEQVQNQSQSQAGQPHTDYTYVTENPVPGQNYYNGHNQNYTQEPIINFEVEDLQDKIFSYGLMSTIFSYVGFLSIVGIILGAVTGKKVKKLKGMGYQLKGKAKAGEILGKIGLILGIVVTSICVCYFLVLGIIVLGAILLGDNGGVYL